MIRVLLVYDRILTREGLRKILEEATGVHVVGQATDADEALAMAGQHDPDVIVVDLATPGSDALSAVKQRHPPYAQIPIIVFTPPAESVDAGRLLRVGALGYVCPEAEPADLIEAVRTVHAGQRYVCRHLMGALKQARAEERETPQPLSQLTKRELQVLRQLATGKPNREIARALGLSPKTVSTHRMHILSKLRLRSNAELARFAVQHNLLDA